MTHAGAGLYYRHAGIVAHKAYQAAAAAWYDQINIANQLGSILGGCLVVGWQQGDAMLVESFGEK